MKVARYGGVAQLFHWAIAALIVTQFALAWSAEDLPLGLHKLALLARHKSVGMTVFVLAICRLAWRLRRPPPQSSAVGSIVEQGLARAMHAGLYLLLFAIPLTGWLMSSAKNYPVTWFGLFTWPNLIPPDTADFELLKSVHGYLNEILLVAVVLHLAAALKHHFWNKDDVLVRMLPVGESRAGDSSR